MLIACEDGFELAHQELTDLEKPSQQHAPSDNLRTRCVLTGNLTAPRPRFQFEPFRPTMLDRNRRCSSHHNLSSPKTWFRDSHCDLRGWVFL